MFNNGDGLNYDYIIVIEYYAVIKITKEYIY